MIDDVLIIGKGPAGISAALYVRRANLSVTVIGKDEGALKKADRIENYFGLKEPLSGEELLGIGHDQALALGARIVTDEVFAVDWDGAFTVQAKGGVYRAHAVILASGAARRTLRIDGIDSFEGRGVSYCALCDAFFYRDKPIAVLGGGEYALHEIEQLLPIVKSITLLTNGAPVTAEFPASVRIVRERVAAVFGEELLAGARLADGSEIRFDGLFIALGSAGAGELARKIGAQVDNNKIVVDEDMATTVPGLFAAGDCIGGLLQVSAAVSEGAQAAVSAIAFARKAKKGAG